MVTIEAIEQIQQRVDKKNNLFRKKLNRSPLLFNTAQVTNNFGETLTRVNGEIPLAMEIKTGDRFLFISYEQTHHTHGIHKYPAKFFPELPRWLIKKYSNKGDLVLDPFGGSATTNIEALLAGRNSVFVDIDPFAKLLAKVKTQPLNNQELEQYSTVLINKISQFKLNNNLQEYLPDFPYRDNWFNQDIIYELAYIKKNIDELACSTALKEFFLITFSSIIRSVSNADNNCTRTVIRKKLNKQIYPTLALTKFIENLLLYKLRLTDFNKNFPLDSFVDIATSSDAKNIHYPDDSFDLAVTSPPYVNAVDYPRTHQLELYWLGLEKGSLTALKKKHIGTESVSSNDYQQLHLIGVAEADKVLKCIYNLDKRRAYIAYQFLIDMEKNIQEVHRTLKPGARYIIVIGNNTIRGYNFESWRYLIGLAERNNFAVETYFGSEIIRHFIKIKREERINTDWVLVLKKKIA